jgi:hypothetical protein
MPRHFTTLITPTLPLPLTFPLPVPLPLPPPPPLQRKEARQESKPLYESFYLCCGFSLADGHTTSNAPDLFRPPKLSGVGPGQY